MKPVHPGRLLRREMQARKLSANALALALRVSSGRITDILNEKRGVSPETAMRLARYFGNSPRFWLNLQTTYELEVAEAELGERIAAEVAPAAARHRLEPAGARKPPHPVGPSPSARTGVPLDALSPTTFSRKEEGSSLPPQQPGRPCGERDRHALRAGCSPTR